MKKTGKFIICFIFICIIFTGCEKKNDKSQILNNYVLDTAVHFCYDIIGYNTQLNNYYIVESNNNIPEGFPRDYYILENDTPVFSFTVNYSDEPMYGGYVCLYGEGQIAFSKYSLDVKNNIQFNDQSKVCLNEYLLKDEDIVFDLINIEDIRIVSGDDIKSLMDYEYFKSSKEEIEISNPIINYYAQLENYPSYINRKDILAKVIEDVIIRYLVIKDNQAIGIIEYDAYYDNKIIKQYKTNDIDIDCKFMITTNGASNVYYLTGNITKDIKEINKYTRISNAFKNAYEQLCK